MSSSSSGKKYLGDRHIPHDIPDYSTYTAFQLQRTISSSSDTSEHTPQDSTTFQSSPLHHQLCHDTRQWVLRNVDLITKKFPPASHSAPISISGRFKEDSSVYVGCGGNAYLHWRLARFFTQEGNKQKADFHLKGAVSAVEVSLSLLPKKFRKGDDIAFYIGAAGIHALSAVVYWMSGHPSKTETHLEKLLGFLGSSLSSEAPDEILYGRAGYLFCLLLVQKHTSKELCQRMRLEEVARQVFDAIMESGKKNSGIKPPDSGELVYWFLNSDFHGAAHGTSGILYMLLQFPSWCQEQENLPWINATLDAILNSQYPSGNFPGRLRGGDIDRLVHWCHGASGVIYTLYHAHKVLGQHDKTTLRSLDQALSCIWQRGLLKKGVGLCHGTSGSGYAFLMMHRYTGGDEHLYRAHKIAEAMRSEEVQKEWAAYRDSQRFTVGVPDFPFSLMEGLGGAICFCCDLLHPSSAAFPGYEGDI